MLSRVGHRFSSKEQVSFKSWLESPTTVTLQPKKIKSVTVSIVSPSISHEVMGLAAFSLSSFTFIKRLFSFSLLSATRVVSSAYLRFLVFLLAIVIPACASSTLAFHKIYSDISYINRVTILSLDILLSQFGIILLCHVWF